MFCHVYNPNDMFVFTITMRNMQSGDTMFGQCCIRYSMIECMKLHQVPKLCFGGFMAKYAQANWSAVWSIPQAQCKAWREHVISIGGNMEQHQKHIAPCFLKEFNESVYD